MSSLKLPWCLVAVLLTSAAAHGAGRIVITEIMYNPASNESKGETEWVEIANVGDEAVEIKDWKLDDEDTRPADDWGPFSCTIQPKEVVVLVNAGAVSEKAFRAAWDAPDASSAAPSYQVIPIKWGNLANKPSLGNEVLRLVNDKAEVICEVNFQNGGAWPELGSKGGPSLWLTNVLAADFNDGSLWRASVAEFAGARTSRPTDVFKGPDIGSPGLVPGVNAPEVAAAPPSEPRKADPPAEEEQKPAKKDNTIDY